MCVAIPVRITEILPEAMSKGIVGNGGVELTFSTVLLKKAPQAGDYVMVHAGFAMHSYSREEAEQNLALFKSLTKAT